jgi:hypothetical protein
MQPPVIVCAVGSCVQLDELHIWLRVLFFGYRSRDLGSNIWTSEPHLRLVTAGLEVIQVIVYLTTATVVCWALVTLSY